MDNLEELKKLVEAVQPLEKARPAKVILAESATEECACGRKALVKSFPVQNSGVCTFINNVCPGCEEGHKLDTSTSRIICVRCKSVVSRVGAPFTDTDGFHFKPNHTLHTNSCPTCHDKKELENTPAVLLEKHLYLKKKGK